jgi:hypothetical protein
VCRFEPGEVVLAWPLFYALYALRASIFVHISYTPTRDMHMGPGAWHKELQRNSACDLSITDRHTFVELM